jgi:hypothetical protein
MKEVAVKSLDNLSDIELQIFLKKLIDEGNEIISVGYCVEKEKLVFAEPDYIPKTRVIYYTSGPTQ